MEHGHSKAHWNLVLCRRISSLFLDIADWLQLFLLKNKALEIRQFFQVILRMEELRLVHPSKSCNMPVFTFKLRVEKLKSSGYLVCNAAALVTGG